MTSCSYPAGIDWANRSHSVCVLDSAGRVELRLDLPHNKEGIERLIRQLDRFKDIAVAIERPSGPVVEAPIEAGLRAVPIHPNVLKASRARYRSAGKSNPDDAYMLADLLRTDGHRFRALEPQCDEIRALRAPVRTRDDLLGQRIALAFVDRYPTPQSAARPGKKRLASFLAQHGYCERRPAAALLKRLRAAPGGHTGELEAEAKGGLVRSLGRILERSVTELTKPSARIEHTVASLTDGQITISSPRSGRICAAQILAELDSVRERFPTEAQLAAQAGVAPLTYASGKHRSVVFRFACNHRLRRAITCSADNSRHGNPWAAQLYQRARSRGCDHPHAIRIPARACTRVLWRAWFNRTPYEPKLHRAAMALHSTKD